MQVSDFIEHIDSTTSSFTSIIDDTTVDEYLSHHGIKDQKWGVRRYQNADGSLTPMGRVRYGVGVASKAAGSAAGKIGSAIKRKVNPSVEDLEKKYAKEQEKLRKRELKNAINETKKSGRPVKQRVENMSAKEAADELNRLKNQQALKDYKKENSALHKIGKGAKLTAQGVAFTAKVAGKAVSPLGELGGDLVMRGLRNAGENWVDDLTASKYTKAKNKADMAKNIFDAAKNQYELDRINSGEYQEAQRLKTEAENAKNQAIIVENRKKAAKANSDKPTMEDLVKKAQQQRDISQAYRDEARARAEEVAIRGDKQALKDIRNFANASKGKRTEKKQHRNN